MSIYSITNFHLCLLLREGKIYDPADIAIVNKFNGVEDKDIGLDIPRNPQLVLNLP